MIQMDETNIKEDIKARLTNLLEKSGDDAKAVIIPKIEVLSSAAANMLIDAQNKVDISANQKHIESIFASLGVYGRLRARVVLSEAIEGFTAAVATAVIKNLFQN